MYPKTFPKTLKSQKMLVGFFAGSISEFKKKIAAGKLLSDSYIKRKTCLN
jgi:predicted DNA-binding transcriptional regulator AlpA